MKDPLKHLRSGTAEYERALALGEKLEDYGHTDFRGPDCLAMVLAQSLQTEGDPLGRAIVTFRPDLPWGEPFHFPPDRMEQQRSTRHPRSVTACLMERGGVPAFSYAAHAAQVIDVLTGPKASERLRWRYFEGHGTGPALEVPDVSRIVGCHGTIAPGRTVQLVLAWGKSVESAAVSIRAAGAADDTGLLKAEGLLGDRTVTVELDLVVQCGRLRTRA